MSLPTVILAGSGRSGTTWIGRILSASPLTRHVFEPLHREEVAAAAQLPTRPYARRDGDYPQLNALFDRLLAGEMRSEWLGKQRFATRQLVKTIRATLLLSWLNKQYQLPVIYVTRHPCAVVHSRVKLGWDTHLDGLLAQNELVEDWLAPHVDRISSAKSPVERHATMWCVENLLTFGQAAENSWITTSYEQFVLAPKKEAARLLNALGWRKSLWTQRALSQVSPVARPDSAVVTGRHPLTDWQQKMSSQDVKIVLDTVTAFGIQLYDETPLPRSLASTDAQTESLRTSKLTRRTFHQPATNA